MKGAAQVQVDCRHKCCVAFDGRTELCLKGANFCPRISAREVIIAPMGAARSASHCDESGQSVDQGQSRALIRAAAARIERRFDLASVLTNGPLDILDAISAASQG